MCGRFTFQPTEEFYKRFHLANRLDTLVARYNIAPSQLVPVIISQSPNQVVLMRWGLIPHWAKEEKACGPQNYRYLILASGYLRLCSCVLTSSRSKASGSNSRPTHSSISSCSGCFGS
jgi:SOS response associated peptidase (SRAP)